MTAATTQLVDATTAEATTVDVDANPTWINVDGYRRMHVEPSESSGPRMVHVEYFAEDERLAADELRLRPPQSQTMFTPHGADRMCVTSRGESVTLSLRDIGPRSAIPAHLMLLGSMKSGTTSLHGHLKQHPQLAINHTAKEPDFFSKYYEAGHLAYFSQYRFDPQRHLWAVDASTNYTKHRQFPRVPERLAQLPGHMMFIYVMRNPVDRIESHIAHNVARGRFEVDYLPEEAQLDCIDVSRYSVQLDKYDAVFENFRERLLLLDFHDVVSALPRVLRRIEQFAGLHPHDYTFLAPRNVRRTDRGAGKIKLSDEQRRWFWEQVKDEPARLRERYGFVPRQPWGP